MKVQQTMERIREEHLQKEDAYEEDEEIQMEDLEQALLKFEDTEPQVHNLMKEVKLGIVEEPRIIYISSLLPSDFKEEIIATLQEFKDYFAWNYDEMPRLDRSLVEHRLPIKPKFHLFQQPPRRMFREVEMKVKEEVENTGKLRVCVDFRDLNATTPKDMYVVPITDMLVDSTANNEL